MGSFTAIGGIKAGEKSVTAFESEDCATALAVAKFKAFAKPGGSSYVVRVQRSTNKRSASLFRQCPSPRWLKRGIPAIVFLPSEMRDPGYVMHVVASFVIYDRRGRGAPVFVSANI